jgi:hypothetical protein
MILHAFRSKITMPKVNPNTIIEETKPADRHRKSVLVQNKPADRRRKSVCRGGYDPVRDACTLRKNQVFSEHDFGFLPRRIGQLVPFAKITFSPDTIFDFYRGGYDRVRHACTLRKITFFPDEHVNPLSVRGFVFNQTVCPRVCFEPDRLSTSVRRILEQNDQTLHESLENLLIHARKFEVLFICFNFTIKISLHAEVWIRYPIKQATKPLIGFACMNQ